MRTKAELSRMYDQEIQRTCARKRRIVMKASGNGKEKIVKWIMIISFVLSVGMLLLQKSCP